MLLLAAAGLATKRYYIGSLLHVNVTSMLKLQNNTKAMSAWLKVLPVFAPDQGRCRGHFPPEHLGRVG